MTWLKSDQKYDIHNAMKCHKFNASNLNDLEKRWHFSTAGVHGSASEASAAVAASLPRGRESQGGTFGRLVAPTGHAGWPGKGGHHLKKSTLSVWDCEKIIEVFHMNFDMDVSMCITLYNSFWSLTWECVSDIKTMGVANGFWESCRSRSECPAQTLGYSSVFFSL